MKNKAIILISEAMAGILLLLFFFWRLYFQPILKIDESERLMGTGMLWLGSKLHTPYGFDRTTGIFLSVSPIS